MVNLAARLCSEASGGQLLMAPAAYAAAEGEVEVEPVGPLTLKGFNRPIPAYAVSGLRDAAASSDLAASRRAT